MNTISNDFSSIGTQTSTSGTAASGRGMLWTSRVLTAIAVLFLTFDCSIHLMQIPAAVKGTAELGYPASSLLVIGVIELVCLLAYLIPRTAVLGAILWTGYLGGAIATHLRVGNPLFSHTLFPIYVAALLWGGLWLRDAKLRALIPLRTR
jgi:hypothetical protein